MEFATVKSLETILLETDPPVKKIDIRTNMPLVPEWIKEMEEALKTNDKKRIVESAYKFLVTFLLFF